MPFSPSHLPMQSVQPTAAGFYDSNQQLCVSQQMQQLQQGTSFYSQILRVNLKIFTQHIVPTYILLSTNNKSHPFLHYLKGESLHGKK